MKMIIDELFSYPAILFPGGHTSWGLNFYYFFFFFFL